VFTHLNTLFRSMIVAVAILGLSGCSTMEGLVDWMWGEDERPEVDKEQFIQKRRPISNPQSFMPGGAGNAQMRQMPPSLPPGGPSGYGGGYPSAMPGGYPPSSGAGAFPMPPGATPFGSAPGQPQGWYPPQEIQHQQVIVEFEPASFEYTPSKKKSDEPTIPLIAEFEPVDMQVYESSSSIIIPVEESAVKGAASDTQKRHSSMFPLPEYAPVPTAPILSTDTGAPVNPAAQVTDASDVPSVDAPSAAPKQDVSLVATDAEADSLVQRLEQLSQRISRMSKQQAATVMRDDKAIASSLPQELPSKEIKNDTVPNHQMVNNKEPLSLPVQEDNQTVAVQTQQPSTQAMQLDVIADIKPVISVNPKVEPTVAAVTPVQTMTFEAVANDVQSFSREEVAIIDQPVANEFSTNLPPIIDVVPVNVDTSAPVVSVSPIGYNAASQNSDSYGGNLPVSRYHGLR